MRLATTLNMKAAAIAASIKPVRKLRFF